MKIFLMFSLKAMLHKLYLALHGWQVVHILDGIQQADTEEFATDDEVQAIFELWRQ